jgi:hypothetical protein
MLFILTLFGIKEHIMLHHWHCTVVYIVISQWADGQFAVRLCCSESFGMCKSMEKQRVEDHDAGEYAYHSTSSKYLTQTR